MPHRYSLIKRLLTPLHSVCAKPDQMCARDVDFSFVSNFVWNFSECVLFYFFCMLLPLFQIKNFLLSFPPIHNMTSPVIFISIMMLLKVSMSFKIDRFCWEFIQDVFAWVHVCGIHVILLHSDDDQMKTVKYTVKPALVATFIKQ